MKTETCRRSHCSRVLGLLMSLWLKLPSNRLAVALHAWLMVCAEPSTCDSVVLSTCCARAAQGIGARWGCSVGRVRPHSG